MSTGRTSGTTRVVFAALLIAAVAVVDWQVDSPITFGVLYLFPILLVGTVLHRWQVVLTALLCTGLAEAFDPHHFTWAVSMPQDILVFTSLVGMGMFAFEITRSRGKEIESRQVLEREVVARRVAEEQLEFLIDSSPMAILIMSADAQVLRANQAAHRLFGLAVGSLPGRSIRPYVPVLGRVPFQGEAPQTFRTEMQCRGVKENGEIFLAEVFFSTYKTAMGPRLAALVVDASEQLREHEEASLEQLMAGSRILVGAVSHEVRNVCGAIGVIYENLVRGGALRGNQDFEALGALVGTLNRIASMELKQTAPSQATGADLNETIDDLRIVLEPYCRDAEIQLHWNIEPDLPPVWADRHSLLQVLLNLAKNSQRAMENCEVKRVDIEVSARGGMVTIRVTDSGPGIRAANYLFQPFQKGAESTGLGLYLSRAFLRSFHGDLRHDPSVPGCSFIIELAISGAPESGLNAAKHGTHSTLIA